MLWSLLLGNVISGRGSLLRPKNQMSKKPQSRFIAILCAAGAYIVAAFWLCLVYTGEVLVSRSETDDHSHLVGWTILFVASSVLVTTMDHWVKFLPVIFGAAIPGALLAAGTGHLPNGRPFPRSIAVALMALLVGCGLVSRTFARRKLTILDRAALIGFVVAFVTSMGVDMPTSILVCFGIGFACLVAAWLRNRLSSESTHKLKKAAHYP